MSREQVYFDLYELREITGIDVDTLSGLIEENRLSARIINGEYKITAEDFEEYANSILFQML